MPSGTPLRAMPYAEAGEDDERRQRDRVPAPLDEVVVGVLEDGHMPRYSKLRDLRGATASARTSCATRSTAVKTLDSRPIVSVVAKPRIGPVPNWNRNAAEISDATWVSRMVSNTRSKPAATACFAPLPAASSSLMRSKISTFESTPMPIVRMKPAMPGSVMVGAEIGHQAEQDDQVDDDRDQRVEAGQLVVEQHEQRDQQQAAGRRQHAGANRVGAERRADRALFEVGQDRRQRARAQLQRQVLRLPGW